MVRQIGTRWENTHIVYIYVQWERERKSEEQKYKNKLKYTERLYIYIYIYIYMVWFYGISTIVCYLMPNPAFTGILDIWLVDTFYWYTQWNDQTVLFQSIQFSVSQQS